MRLYVGLIGGVMIGVGAGLTFGLISGLTFGLDAVASVMEVSKRS